MEESTNDVNGDPYMDSAQRNETTPLQGGANEMKGLKVIISCLSVMTAIVSIALAAQIYYGDNYLQIHGSVVTDHHDCTLIGAKMLHKGGNAVDAAIASTFCMGVVHPHLTGIGGGGFLMIYNQKRQKAVDCIDFRASQSVDSRIGVPGVVAGLHTAHALYGSLSWTDVIMPSVELAKKGFRVSESLASSVDYININSTLDSELKDWLLSLKAGSVAYASQLGNTLQTIASQGMNAFYNGTLAKEMTGHLLPRDMSNYQVERQTCIHGSHQGLELIVPPAGSGGPYFLDIINNVNITGDFETSLVPLISSFNFDLEINWPFEAGVEVLAVDDNDLYVSAVSGLGSILGSQVFLSGGYLLNDALDLGHVGNDNKPSSLFLPLIAVDHSNICGRRLITGGTDCRDVLQLALQLLYTKNDLQACIEAPRARISSVIFFEERHAPSFKLEEKNALKKMGFTIEDAPVPYPSLNAIEKVGDVITSYADSRGQGEAIVL